MPRFTLTNNHIESSGFNFDSMLEIGALNADGTRRIRPIQDIEITIDGCTITRGMDLHMDTDGVLHISLKNVEVR